MAKYRVVKLTEEALKVQCNTDDYEEWGAPVLTLPQYIGKDAAQRSTPFSQRGSIVWALVEDTGNSNMVAGETVLYCHCESHRFDCAVRRSSGEIERGYSYHIGSVFTLPEHRKRGLAKLFLNEAGLGKYRILLYGLLALSPWNEVAKQLQALPGALVSVLYSDIGPTYYDKLGWKLHPSKMATLDVEHPKNAPVDSESSTNLVSLTLDGELNEFLQADNARLVEELKSDKLEGQEAFAVLPNRDSIEWQFCVGVYYAQLRQYEEFPSRCGVIVNKDAFLIWCHSLKASTLYILRARLPTVGGNAVEATRLLLGEALKEAHKFKLKKVAIWNPPLALADQAVRDHLEIAFVDREDSLSSAMVFRSDPASSVLPHWAANEKYAWV